MMGRQCPECSRDFEDGDTLFDHLLDQHGYSMDYAEDTVIGTDPDLNTPSYSKESMEDEAGVWWDSLSISDRENLIGGGAQSDSWDLDKQLSWSELQTRPNYDPSQSFFDSSTTVNDILTTYVSGFYKAQGLDDAQWDETGGDWDGNMRPDWSDTGGQSNTWFGSVLNPTLTTRSGNTLNYESKASESANTKEDIEAVMNVHGDDWTDEEIIQQVAKMGAYPLGSTPTQEDIEYITDKLDDWYSSRRELDNESKAREYNEWEYEGVNLADHMDIEEEGGRTYATCEWCEWHEEWDNSDTTGDAPVDVISNHLRRNHNVYKGSGNESKAREDDPDYLNDPDYQGYTEDEFGNKIKSHPSQYTIGGMDFAEKELKRNRGDVDDDIIDNPTFNFEALQKKYSMCNSCMDKAFKSLTNESQMADTIFQQSDFESYDDWESYALANGVSQQEAVDTWEKFNPSYGFESKRF